MVLQLLRMSLITVVLFSFIPTITMYACTDSLPTIGVPKLAGRKRRRSQSRGQSAARSHSRKPPRYAKQLTTFVRYLAPICQENLTRT